MHCTQTATTALAFLMCLALAACSQSLQKQIDTQGQTIARMQEQMLQVSREQARHQATYASEFDRIRSELQALRGTLDETVFTTGKELKAANGRIENIMAYLRSQTAAAAATPGSDAVAKQPDTQTPPGQPAAKDDQGLYAQAFELYQKGEYAKGLTAFQTFLKQHPGSDLADNAMFWIGNCYYQQKKFEAAIAAFEDVIKKFPQGNKVPDAYYLQALAFIELQDPLTAQILLETLIQNYPKTEAANSAKKKYGELKKNQPKYKEE